MNKRGISAIVATVLIILITVAAVTILWAVIIPMIQDNLDFSSLEGRVSVVTSEGYTYYDAEGELASVQVKRDVDDGVMNRIKIAFSVDGDDFSSSVVAPESGSTRVYIFDLSGYGDPESVSVAPIFAVENREKEGPETSAAVIGKEKVAADVVGSAYLGTVYSLGEDYTFDIGEGLVAYWRFEGNMEDSSENGNEGSLINMAPESGNWVDGKVGKALSFDGVDDYVNIPDNQSLDITDEITIGMWVMTNSQADPLSKHWNIMRVILFEGNNTKVVYQIGGANITTSSFDNVIQTGSWHHIVWTYNGSLTQVYVDGDPNGFSKEASGDLLTSSNPLYIGRYSDSYFNGLIDELMIYDRALSAEEIKNLYDIQKD